MICSENVASQDGGAIFANVIPGRVMALHLIDSLLSANTALGDGGGMYTHLNRDGCSIEIRGSIFTSNTAFVQGGGFADFGTRGDIGASYFGAFCLSGIHWR